MASNVTTTSQPPRQPNPRVLQSQLSQSSSGSSHSNLTQNLSLLGNLYKSLTTEDQKLQFLLQNCYALSKDQQGCRRLQKKIDEQMEQSREQGLAYA